PVVINDQRGRPTYAEDLAKGIKHLLESDAEYGVYNLSSSGDAVGRDEVAMAVFIGVGHDPAEVHSASTEQYNAFRAQQASSNGQPAPQPEDQRQDESPLDLRLWSKIGRAHV